MLCRAVRPVSNALFPKRLFSGLTKLLALHYPELQHCKDSWTSMESSRAAVTAACAGCRTLPPGSASIDIAVVSNFWLGSELRGVL